MRPDLLHEARAQISVGERRSGGRLIEISELSNEEMPFIRGHPSPPIVPPAAGPPLIEVPVTGR